jgi:hypothetical protein
MPRDDGTIKEWFVKYREFVMFWAFIAQREGKIKQLFSL